MESNFMEKKWNVDTWIKYGNAFGEDDKCGKSIPFSWVQRLYGGAGFFYWGFNLEATLVTVLGLTCPLLCSHKSKKAKRRLRKPGTVPLAYAKVMKKLNFCG
nr:formin-like protein 20 [Ipomoea batatas]